MQKTSLDIGVVGEDGYFLIARFRDGISYCVICAEELNDTSTLEYLLFKLILAILALVQLIYRRAFNQSTIDVTNSFS